MERIIHLGLTLAIGIAVLITERYLETSTMIRTTLGVFSGSAVLICVIFRAKQSEWKNYWASASLWSLSLTVAFLSYCLWDTLELSSLAQILLFTIWGSCALIYCFFTCCFMTQAPYLTLQNNEPLRFQTSFRAWTFIGILAVSFGAINWSAHQVGFQADLTYSQTALPSSDTQKLIESHTGLKATAFFPRDHDIGQRVSSYFKHLDIPYSLLDKDEALDEAHKLHINRNGFLVITNNNQQPQYLDIGLQHHTAMANLRNLDQQVQTKLNKLVAPTKVVYMTQGHGEAPIRGGRHPVSGLTTFRSWIASQNYKVKPLSLHEGLDKAIPGDADLIIIAGAKESFLTSEISSIETWVENGGKLWVWMDPLTEDDGPLSRMLHNFGLTFHSDILSHPSKYLTASAKAREEKTMLFTQRVLQHPSVQRFYAHKDKANFFVYRSGWLEVHDEGNQAWDAEALIQALPGTTSAAKSGVIFGLGAIAWKKDAKVSVLSNSNSLGDLFLRNPGNAMYASDTLSWLSGDPTHLANSEEDVRIQHSEASEKLLFYGTTTMIPCLILICGWFATRRSRRPQPKPKRALAS